MSKVEENPRIEVLLKIEDLAKLHQSVFEDTYNLAYSQEKSWVDSSEAEPNPNLFTQAEQILKPLFLSWREKYTLFRQAISEGKVPYERCIHSFVWQEKTEAGKELYYINHSEEIDDPAINYDLQIRKPGICIYSHPVTDVSWRQKDCHWEEKFDFSVNFHDTQHQRKINFKIGAKAGTVNCQCHDFPVHDRLSLHLNEEVTPFPASKSYFIKLPILQRSVQLSVWRPSLSDLLPPNKLVDDLSGTISSLGFKRQREAYFKK